MYCELSTTVARRIALTPRSMSQETSPSDATLPARRRIVALPERRVALPVAIIAHEGEERDQLETQISRVRPAVSFPSLAHFGAEAARGERWAGIVVARTHAWDARLDTSVPRRAFIALFRLTDEGHGWPESVRRIGTPEELDAWLTDLAAPVLPADDRKRVVKPRAKRSVFTMSLSGPDPEPARKQLTLPSLSIPAKAKVVEAQQAASTSPEASVAAEGMPEGTALAKAGSVTGASPAKTKRATRKARSQSSHGLGDAPEQVPAAQELPAQVGTSARTRSGAAIQSDKVARSATRAVAPQGLRLTSDDADEQAVIDAVRVLGAAQARAIIDTVEQFEQD